MPGLLTLTPNEDTAAPPTVSLDPVQVIVEAAFGALLGDLAYSWTDITSETFNKASTLTYSRGTTQAMGKMETGNGSILLKDMQSAFDPRNGNSPYYPYVEPMVPVRASIVIGDQIYPLFQHYVERWPRTNRSTNRYSEYEVGTVDAFAIYAATALQTTHATLNTTLVGTNNDLVWTAYSAGAEWNDWTVEYVVAGINTTGTLTASAATNSIVVGIATDGSGNPTTTAADIVRAAAPGDPYDETGRRVVRVTLAGTDNGTGILTAMAPTHLSGGGYPEQLSGLRIAAVLDTIGRPSTLRDIDTGRSTIAANGFDSADDAKALDHLLAVTASEGGFYFIDAQGNDRFIDRSAILLAPTAVPVAVFTDNEAAIRAGTGIRYVHIDPENDAADIVNDWTGTREGSTTTQRVQDAASQGRYLIRSQSVQSVVASDDELLYQLQWLNSRSKDAHARVSKIAVMPGNSGANWATVLGIEIGDLVTVQETLPGSTVDYEADYIVMHLNAQITPDILGSRFEFDLEPADRGPYLILDDATYGILDSGVEWGW